MSHTATAEQKADFDGEAIELRSVNPELNALTEQIPPEFEAADFSTLAARVVAEAVKAGATHFAIAGEQNLCMHANLAAKAATELICIQSVSRRVSIDTPQADGTVLKTSVFKHERWRNVF